jgi:uncharacterized surface protein with fasciclin (FAS1) repeats
MLTNIKINYIMCILPVPYTLIMPSDAAIASLPPSQLSALQANSSNLVNVLKFHLIKGALFTFDMRTGQTLQTSNGHFIRLYTSGDVSFGLAGILCLAQHTSG